jgi:hypothetical protein
MKKIADPGTNKATYIEDAYVLTARNRFFKRYATLLGLLCLAVVMAAAWATNHFYIEPKRDADLVSKALQKLESTGSGRAQLQRLTRGNASDRVAKTYLLLTPSESGRGDRDHVEQYLAALRMAMRAGIPEAKLSYGEALREGLTGKRDSAAALKIFDEVAREIEPGIRAGDPVSMYVAAIMLKKGLGKEPDPQKAMDLAKRAISSLDGWRLETAGKDLAFGEGLFKSFRDPDLLTEIAGRLIKQKSESGPLVGSFSCFDKEPQNLAQCDKDWYERGVNRGIESAIPDYARSLLDTGEPLESVDRWFARGEAYSFPSDRYQHAVVKAMLATDDFALLSALREMRNQIQADKILPDDPLPYINFYNFSKAIEGKKSQKVDNFLIALNVSGIFTDSLESNQKELRSTLGRPDLLARAKSPEIMHKSQIAARAILDGVPLEKIKLSPTVNPSKSLDPVSAESRQLLPTVRSQKMAAIAQPADRDPEQQDKTGYLKDQPRSAIGGLSTFTVDNRQGGKDAVARIYLNGQKPAVRSMYVKHGETFKAEAILPGTYVFRYRFIGSEDTFESDKSFQLKQIETETGTRYSNVIVTLFKVKDGNMSTRKVDPNSF